MVLGLRLALLDVLDKPLLRPKRITTSLLAFLYNAFISAPLPAALTNACNLLANNFEKGDTNMFLRLFPIILLSGSIVTNLKLELAGTETSEFTFSSNRVVFPFGSGDTVKQITPPVLLYSNE